MDMDQQAAVKALREEWSEEALWNCVVAWLPILDIFRLAFQYRLKKGRNGDYTRELFIDRRENSKSLAWSSIRMAFRAVREIGAVVDRPKALGDIRGVTYIYALFYRFGLIDVPEAVRQTMEGTE